MTEGQDDTKKNPRETMDKGRGKEEGRKGERERGRKGERSELTISNLSELSNRVLPNPIFLNKSCDLYRLVFSPSHRVL